MLALALASGGAVLAATAPYGPAVDGDGVLTLSAAENFREGRGLVTFSGDPYTSWPPLYPVSVAALEMAGVERLEALRWLHGACAAATVLLGARLVRVASASPRLGALDALLAATSVALYWQLFQMGSEAPFVALALAALACCVRYVETRRMRALIGAVALAALACLQRYVGVIVIAVVAIVLVSDGGEPRLAPRAKRAAFAAGASAFPLGVWLLRNHRLEGRWIGARDEPRATWIEASLDAARGVAAWIFPAHPESSSGLGIACAVGLAALCACAGFARDAGGGSAGRASRVALASFFALYLASLVTASATIDIDRISQRLLFPALPVALALALLGLHGLARRGFVRFPRADAVAAASVAGIVALLAARGARDVSIAISDARREGVGGFRTRFWDEHELVRRLRAAPPIEPIHSNLPELVYLESGAAARMLWPSRAAHARVGKRAADERRPQTVVWFQHDGKPRLFVDEIERAARVERLFEGAVGSVLLATPR